jgi:replicative DNA helicase
MLDNKIEPKDIFDVYGLDDLKRDLTMGKSGLKTGYRELDKFISIPQGAITIIAGRPAHGKTTFQLNLLVNLLNDESLTDKKFYFFSYEEARMNLSTKLIMIMADIVLDKKHNYGAYINYLKKGHDDNYRKQREIDRSLELFDKLTKFSKRLYLMDHAYRIDNLVDRLKRLDSRKIGAIFIDYIQKINCFNPQQWQRYMEIKEISYRLVEYAKQENIPVIMGAQANRAATNTIKLTQMRESGDIEQDANLILGVHNKLLSAPPGSDAEAEGNAQYMDNGIVSLRIRILKNRTGVAWKDVNLLFHPSTLKITSA